MNLTRSYAQQILSEASSLNSGPWFQHSLLTGLAAQRIASLLTNLNPERAYIAGLLHDIGRRYGRTDLKHTIDGHRYLQSFGQDFYSRICLTHSFPTRMVGSYFGKVDVTQEELRQIQNFIENVEYNDYDRLIQLCDHLAHPNGYCIVEKRMVDVALRYGVQEAHKDKWAKILEIKNDFDSRIGKSVYALLPGICYGTFGTEDLLPIRSGDPEGDLIGE